MKLGELLKKTEASGVYLLDEAIPASEVEHLVRGLDFTFFHLQGSRILSKTDFLIEIAATLRFPDYFGYNWDALADCMTDITGGDENSRVILFDRFDLFAENSPAEFATALEIFGESAIFLSQRGIGCFVLLQGRRSAAPELPKVEN
ncbi:barstar family protein [Desulfomonile tiedjei]|uniref:Barstar (Barnase inhibitor) n=1 Tax=Desulfomonile tiedjei (strain ATCC 49306 / DSM 6799 / DCB-1) TaxID=706587 RepID=I4C6Y9_DESTA|nr:barstar family protein [Desulfomonile tiedjei]AFM25330.1 Barstar (barnase inhibitor) [Desulfomonile tiedjei DSM 6799]